MGSAPDDTNSWRHATQLELIMKFGPLPEALKPGFHRVRTCWIRGFMAFRLARPGRRDETGS